MTVSLLPVIMFSQINVKLLMWVIYILTSAPSTGEDQHAMAADFRALANSLSLLYLLVTQIKR